MICRRHLRIFVDAEKSRSVRKAEIAYTIQASANRRALDAQHPDQALTGATILPGILIAMAPLRIVYSVV